MKIFRKRALEPIRNPVEPGPELGGPDGVAPTTTCSIVIPVHNKFALSQQCLETLLEQHDPGIEREIIVVDDGSSDLTPRLLQNYAQRIKIITHSPGKGFAGACNAGAAAAGGEFLIFLNNDTIPTPTWLSALVEYARAHPNAGIVGSKLLFPDETVQHAGVVFGHNRYPRHIYIGFPADDPAVNTSRQYAAVTAACVLIRRELWESLGGFDTAYRNGWEDVDFCLRAREAGHEVHYCHESVVYHLESVSRDLRAPDESANRGRYDELWKDKVVPDDVAYYLEDGLITITYQARYPIHFAVSPLLASLGPDESKRQGDLLLAERAKQVMILLRNNIVLNTRVVEAELRALDAEQRARAAYRRLEEAGLSADAAPEAAAGDPATAARSHPGNIIGSIEQPGQAHAPLTGHTMSVSGWAHSPFGIQQIEAIIDGAPPVKLSYGLPRPDVVRVHPGYPDGERSGFAGEVSLANLSDGDHVLIVRIYDKQGRFTDGTMRFAINRTGVATSDTAVPTDAAVSAGGD